MNKIFLYLFDLPVFTKCSNNTKLFFRLLIALCFFNSNVRSQQDSSISTKPLSFKKLALIEGGTVALSYTAFYTLWYAQSETSQFHFFNDSKEWQGVDKMGHSFGGYWLSYTNSNLFKKTELNHKTSDFVGSASALVFMSSIEILDGFSKDWGASVWDIAANSGGSIFYLSQQLLWNRQKVYLKYSYFPSDYSQYRPNVLGANHAEKIIKDYNAINFWLSFNLRDITNFNIFPQWINLATGYSADGMIGGHSNETDELIQYGISDSERIHTFYLSLDFDLSKISTNSKLLKNILFCLNAFKVPFPALGYNSQNKFKLVIR